MQRSADAPPPRVSDRAGATALVAGVIASLEALESVLARESDHIRVGRLREGLAETERKGRPCPLHPGAGDQPGRAGHARTVSEGLVKTLADEIGRTRTPTVYGRPSQAPSPYSRSGVARSQPLVLSRSL